MNWKFPCRLESTDDGMQVIRCRDIPELLSWPSDGEDFETWARYAVLDCLAFRQKKGETFPTPSEPLLGEFVVSVTPEEVAVA